MNAQTREITQMADMTEKRAAHKMVKVGDFVYAFGGWDESSLKGHVLKYYIE